MSALADLEIALRRDRAFGLLAHSHSHRAVHEDSLGLIKGRDAIMTRWLAGEPQEATIDADLGEMIAFTATDGTRQWHGHRWVWREEGRIVREVLIEDDGVAKAAPPAHAPLGELRAGSGQYAAGDRAILPPEFPADLAATADRLHTIWNGRCLDRGAELWLVPLIRALPDATFLFERGIAGAAASAILWRVHGHHETGQRIRLIGSSVIDTASGAVTSVLDTAAMAAQVDRTAIDYGAVG